MELPLWYSIVEYGRINTQHKQHALYRGHTNKIFMTCSWKSTSSWLWLVTPLWIYLCSLDICFDFVDETILPCVYCRYRRIIIKVYTTLWARLQSRGIVQAMVPEDFTFLRLMALMSPLRVIFWRIKKTIATLRTTFQNGI